MAHRSRLSWIIPVHAVSQCRTNNKWGGNTFHVLLLSSPKGKRARGSGETERFILSVRPFDPVIAALPNDREVAAAQ